MRRKFTVVKPGVDVVCGGVGYEYEVYVTARDKSSCSSFHANREQLIWLKESIDTALKEEKQ
jgi:hypothetical protein